MGKQTINMSEELKNVETTIGRKAVDYSQDEVQVAKKQIQKLSYELEDALNGYGKISKSDISRVIDQVYEQMSKMVGEKILTTRQSEYLETRHNLSSIVNDNESSREQIEDFKQNGIVLKDSQYQRMVDDICHNLINTFKKKFQDIKDVRAEDTLYDINRNVRKTGSQLMDIHGEYSEKIKKEIVNEVESMGIKIDGKVEEKLENEIISIAQKHGLMPQEENVDKIEEAIKPHVDEFNKFAASLQDGVENEDKTVEKYVEDFDKSKNEVKDKKIAQLGEDIPKL